MLGHFGNHQCADVRQHALFVEAKKRKFNWNGTRRKNHRLALPVRDCAVHGRDFDDVVGLECTQSFRPRDLVLLEEELDTLRILRDNICLARHHRGQVESQSIDRDTVFRRMQSEPFVPLG